MKNLCANPPPGKLWDFLKKISPIRTALTLSRAYRFSYPFCQLQAFVTEPPLPSCPLPTPIDQQRSKLTPLVETLTSNPPLKTLTYKQLLHLLWKTDPL